MFHITQTLKEIKNVAQLILSNPSTKEEYSKDLGRVFEMVDIELKKIQEDPKLYEKSIKIVTEKDPKMMALFERYQSGEEELLTINKLDLNKLSKLPENTLGYKYAKFMLENNLCPTPVIVEESIDFMEFYRNRMLIFHDFVHIAFDLGLDMFGEFGTNGVYVSQIFNPATYILMGTYVAKCFRFKNEKAIETIIAGFVAGYNAGEVSKPISSVVWEDYLETDIDEFRKLFDIKLIKYDKTKYVNFSNINPTI